MRLEHLDESLEQRLMRVHDELRRARWVLRVVVPGVGHPVLAQGHHHRDHLVGAVQHDLRGDAHLGRQVGEPLERRQQVLPAVGRVQGVGCDGVQQRVLVGEDPEDRALGDAGRLGDHLGGEGVTVLEEQGADGVDDRPATVVAVQRSSSRGHSVNAK